MLTTLHFSTDPADIDHEWLFRTLKESYWGWFYSREKILVACRNSLCFSAYVENPRRHIGFARVITDGAITSTINDVIVDERWRGLLVGTRLMQHVIAHPLVAPTICVLKTRDAHGFYTKFGFVSGENWFQRDPA